MGCYVSAPFVVPNKHKSAARRRVSHNKTPKKPADAKNQPKSLPFFDAVRSHRIMVEPLGLLSASVKGPLLRSIRQSLFGGLFNNGGVTRVRLPLVVQGVVASGGVIANVFPIAFTSIVGYAEYVVIFTSFRLLNAQVHFAPVYTVPSGVLAGGVSYNSEVTSPSSVGEIQELSDSRLFSYNYPQLWQLEISRGGGNTDWWSTDDAGLIATVVATLKMVNVTGIGSSTNTGSLWGFVDVEFKGLQ